MSGLNGGLNFASGVSVTMGEYIAWTLQWAMLYYRCERYYRGINSLKSQTVSALPPVLALLFGSELSGLTDGYNASITVPMLLLECQLLDSPLCIVFVSVILLSGLPEGQCFIIGMSTVMWE